jgi:DHA2 family multidrug resistance protein-like MFS transporter
MPVAGARKWWALGAVSLCVLAVTLDGTVLSVALPTLAGALHASESDLEWFSSGYLLLLAAAVLPAGLGGDRFGRKKLLLASLAVFGAGSVLCAEAPNPAVFLLARLLMGLAGAGVTVMAMSALTVLFDDTERARATGVYEAANFLALPLGPILGGWMLSRFWWGWVFLVNVPVVIVGLVVGFALIPESRAAERPGLDPAGTAASVTGVVMVTYGLIEAGRSGWSDPAALVLIAAGLLALAGFAVWERRLAGRGGQPLVDPALFRSASFTSGAVLGGVAGLGMIGLLFSMPQYFQAVRGADAFGSGMRLLPLVGGLIAGALPASALARAIGAKLTVTLGFVLLAVGAVAGTTTRATSGTAFVALWMAVLCAGTGLALTAATAAALSQLSAERSGIGSAVVQAFQKTAGPFGTAIMGSVLAAAYQARLDLTGLPATAAAAARQSVYGGLAIASRVRSAGLAQSARAAFVHGMDVSLVVSAGIGTTGAVLALAFLPRGVAGHRPGREERSLMPASTDRPEPSLRERKKARTRGAIQTHALQLFREQGYDATTIEQIIDAAEVSETTFFRYFPTKEDVVLQDDYDPLIIDAYKKQPPELAPVPAMRAAFAAVFAGMTASQQAEQRERVALILAVPRLRAAMLNQFSQLMQLLADAMAERAGLRPDDFKVRTVAGAVVGATMAVLAAMNDDPTAELGPLTDMALANLESGLTL